MVSFEVDFNFLYTLGIDDAYINRKSATNKPIYHATQQSQTTMFRITPLFGVYANESLLIRPYAKFGIIVPLAGDTKVNLSIEDNSGISFNDLMPVIDPVTLLQTQLLASSLGLSNISVPTKTDIKAVTSGSFSLGFLARFGAEYKFKNVLDGRLLLFAEMEMQMLTVKAHQTVIKEFNSSVNDATFQSLAEAADIKTSFGLDDIPEILKTTDYFNEIIETSNSSYDVSNPNYDRDKAFEQLTFRDNYNAFGCLICLKFGF